MLHYRHNQRLSLHLFLEPPLPASLHVPRAELHPPEPITFKEQNVLAGVAEAGLSAGLPEAGEGVATRRSSTRWRRESRGPYEQAARGACAAGLRQGRPPAPALLRSWSLPASLRTPGAACVARRAGGCSCKLGCSQSRALGEATPSHTFLRSSRRAHTAGQILDPSPLHRRRMSVPGGTTAVLRACCPLESSPYPIGSYTVEAFCPFSPHFPTSFSTACRPSCLVTFLQEMGPLRVCPRGNQWKMPLAYSQAPRFTGTNLRPSCGNDFLTITSWLGNHSAASQRGVLCVAPRPPRALCSHLL